MRYIGKIDLSIIENSFGKLPTNEVVLTDERMQHIKEKHADDFLLLEEYGRDILENPDIILNDEKRENTIFVIKHIIETNMNIIVKLAIPEDDKHPKNSVMTAYRLRDSNLKKLEKKHKILYKK